MECSDLGAFSAQLSDAARMGKVACRQSGER